MSAKRLSDPMGLLLTAARVDPVLMQAARQVDAELRAYRNMVTDLRILVENACDVHSTHVRRANLLEEMRFRLDNNGGNL